MRRLQPWEPQKANRTALRKPARHQGTFPLIDQRLRQLIGSTLETAVPRSRQGALLVLVMRLNVVAAAPCSGQMALGSTEWTATQGI